MTPDWLLLLLCIPAFALILRWTYLRDHPVPPTDEQVLQEYAREIAGRKGWW